MKEDIGAWFVALTVGLVSLIAVVVVLSLLGAGGTLFGLAVDRQAVQQSRQYSETNTDAFYTRLETVKRIDVELAGLAASDPRVPALQSQRSLLVSEMRREVAKIPIDARTSDMAVYQ
jgi:hypothetical protein